MSNDLAPEELKHFKRGYWVFSEKWYMVIEIFSVITLSVIKYNYRFRVLLEIDSFNVFNTSIFDNQNWLWETQKIRGNYVCLCCYVNSYNATSIIIQKNKLQLK